jgi:hypothetical protein
MPEEAGLHVSSFTYDSFYPLVENVLEASLLGWRDE